MVRPIKFRQAIHRNGKFDYFHYWGWLDFPVKGTFTGPANPSDPSQQFIGRIDKNGNEIWEGDIVRDNRSSKEFPYFDHEVFFDLGNFEPFNNCECTSSDHSTGYEIIGNIYENPELVNGQV